MKHLYFGAISADHNGGTKSYHVAWIACADTDRSILMKRYGPTNAFGQVIIETYTTTDGAEEAGRRHLATKAKKGYVQVSKKTDQGAGSMDLKSFFGLAIWNAFGQKAIDFLDADINTAGMPIKAPAVTKDEDGNFVQQRPKLVELDPEVEAAAKRERERDMQELGSNPLFGLF